MPQKQVHAFVAQPAILINHFASIVVRYLEDCPLFNAGKGAVYTNKVRRSAHYFYPSTASKVTDY